MHFYYNPRVGENPQDVLEIRDDWRFYKYYREWQWKTYLLAKDICQKEHIDILHQLNMIGFRERDISGNCRRRMVCRLYGDLWMPRISFLLLIWMVLD